MRRGKKPTRKQKIRLGQAGLAPENWLVVKQKDKVITLGDVSVTVERE